MSGLGENRRFVLARRVSGVPHADDFRLETAPLPLSCVEGINQGYGLNTDLNEDCYTDLQDFAIFAEGWMQ